MRLRDGSTVEDPRLGRLPQFDERSRAFPIRRLVKTSAFPSRGRSWWCPYPRTDQRDLPRCVAYAGGNCLRATPVMNKSATHGLCDRLYAEAQERDQWEGSDYDGTSGLGLAKALTDRGLIDSYYWCFSVEDILLALAHKGPVLVGWPWFNSMFSTGANGRLDVDPDSGLGGYHEVLLRGFSVANKWCRGVNTWGEWYGVRGEFFVTWEDMRNHLLPNQGDALVIHEVRGGGLG